MSKSRKHRELFKSEPEEHSHEFQRHRAQMRAALRGLRKDDAAPDGDNTAWLEALDRVPPDARL